MKCTEAVVTMEIDELLSGDDRAAIARDVEAALMDNGYLMLTGSPLQCVGKALSSWEVFTALPIDIRRRFHHAVRRGNATGGWSLMREHPVYSSHMGDAEMNSGEPKQEYGFSVQTDRTLWPDDRVSPDFATDVATIAALCDGVSRALLNAIETVLGQEPGFLLYEPGYVALKHYPGQPLDDGGAQDAGLHEHSDAVVFTMLAQSVESLQIKCRDGSWLTVPADPGACLLVIPGDWMELFTNGQIPAVRHRVMDTQVPRTSLAFFQNIAPMTVGPLDRFVDDDNPPAYPSVSSDIDYVGGESGVPRWQTA